MAVSPRAAINDGAAQDSDFVHRISVIVLEQRILTKVLPCFDARSARVRRVCYFLFAICYARKALSACWPNQRFKKHWRGNSGMSILADGGHAADF
jgi:hypothetical protein